MLSDAPPAVHPAPNPAGWHRGPVVVGGVTLTQDGEHTIGTTHVRIDRTPPTIAAHTTLRRGTIDVAVTANDALAGAARLQTRVTHGRWRTRSLEDVLFDGSEASLKRWRQSGAGSFTRTADGTLRTVGGLGLLWYAARQFGDAAFRLQWREARADGQRSNGGVFIRFPDADPPRLCDALLPIALGDHAWHAVACGHEIQINDGAVDPQKTGSVYGFAPLATSSPAPHGSWNDYEVRTVGKGAYAVTVVRNGRVLNRFVNTPGQIPALIDPANAPTRVIYPPTDVKQFATGYVGLQNHGDADTIEYRDVRVLPLGPRRTSVVVRRAVRRRTLQVRAIDAAGNRSRTLTIRVPRRLDGSAR